MASKRVRLKDCRNAVEASLLKGFLESQGIEAWTGSGQERAWTGRYSALARGVPVRVAANELTRARAALAKLESDEVAGSDLQAPIEAPEDSGCSAGPDRCPRCGSGHIREISPKRLADFFFALLLLPLGGGEKKKKTRICLDCDYDW